MSAGLFRAFGSLSVLPRAAILCCQTVAVGGIIFLLVIARNPQFRQEAWLRPARRVIRWSALGFSVSLCRKGNCGEHYTVSLSLRSFGSLREVAIGLCADLM
jgi:hypothetical protein